MNYKSILFFLGINFLFVSFLSILNILYSIYFDFIIGINSYLVTLGISIGLGTVLCFIGYKYAKSISLTEQIIFLVLSFALIPLLIGIPYYLSIYDFNFLDAYFESVSGFTTTGFSLIKDIERIDEPLLLWRSSSQWLGGLIFLIGTIGTIGSKQIKIKPSYLISGGASGRNFYNNYKYNFLKIFLIYFFTTVLSIFLFSLADLRLLDAFNLSFTTISSGGFINANNLSDIIKNDIQIFVISITLLFPIFNFFILHDIITKKFSLQKHQEDFHIILLILFLCLLFYFFIAPGEKFFSILLAITSSLSTSGVSIYSPQVELNFLFILLTIIGGSVISTSSGFKYTRIYILLKTSYQEIYRLVKPINIVDKNLYTPENKIDDEDVKISFLVFIFFIISIFILSSLLSLDYFSFEESFKLSILTLTNTLNSSLYGLENISFFDLNSSTKMSLIVFMSLGRIEIIALLFLLKRLIFRE